MSPNEKQSLVDSLIELLDHTMQDDEAGWKQALSVLQRDVETLNASTTKSIGSLRGSVAAMKRAIIELKARMDGITDPPSRATTLPDKPEKTRDPREDPAHCDNIVVGRWSFWPGDGRYCHGEVLGWAEAGGMEVTSIEYDTLDQELILDGKNVVGHRRVNGEAFHFTAHPYRGISQKGRLAEAPCPESFWIKLVDHHVEREQAHVNSVKRRVTDQIGRAEFPNGEIR